MLAWSKGVDVKSCSKTAPAVPWRASCASMPDHQPGPIFLEIYCVTCFTFVSPSFKDTARIAVIAVFVLVKVSVAFEGPTHA
jgi:hypothetical protein